MIQDFHSSSASSAAPTGKGYWRSLDELADTPAFREWLHREFPQGASEAQGVNRRHFLKIMAASFGAAGIGLAGCRRPEAHILPYAKQPENSIPGLPVYYTTSFPDAVDNLPLVVETHQHRPTHIEGNRGYAPYGGGTTVFSQASVLNLYDPDRMTASAGANNKRLSPAEVADQLQKIASTYAQTRGQGLAILAEPSTSPTRARLVKQLKQALPQAKWAEYSPAGQTAADAALRPLFGRPARALYQLDQAKVIVSVDCDFTGAEPGSLALSRGYAAGRRVANQADAKAMNRLYVAETAYTTTGAMADHRLRVPTSALPAFVAALAAEVLSQQHAEAALAAQLKEQGATGHFDETWIRECAADLIAQHGHAVVLPGSNLPAPVQQLVQWINVLIGATKHTVQYVELPDAGEVLSISQLAAIIGQGQVETLVILGGNPVYNAPANLGWKKLQQSVKQVVRLGYYFDETALESDLNIASTHYLESWSDGRTYAGALLPVQPMILPLFDGISELEVLARLAGQTTVDAFALVRETFASFTQEADQQKAFARFLAQGGLFDLTYPKLTAAPNFGSVRAGISGFNFKAPGLSKDSLEVRIKLDDRIGDGFWNNNGWLQEVPDAMTKLTWDNAIFISPKLAEEIGYDTKSGKFLIDGIAKQQNSFVKDTQVSPVAELSVEGVKVSGPLYIMPGLPDYAVVVTLGYGREKVGRVGKGTGYNAYPLTHTDTTARTGAKLSLTGASYPLANTSQHWSMEGRDIIRETNVGHHLENPDWVNHMGMEAHSPPVYGSAKDMPLQEKSLTQPRGNSLYEHPEFGKPLPNIKAWQQPGAMEKFIPEQQWGMVIDLNTCTACNACIIACQSENNIPIVGKEQIAHGREMHWLRLDRYFSSGDVKANQVSLPANPQTAFMPMACVHCESAPCEQVCPVNATVHDSQGLNTMAYNRCVGTRYCANNCPYKVRRFNFFDFNKRNIDELYAGPLGTDKNKTEGGQLAAMQKNPDVTVRMRGVMEKCTYCVQRIQTARIAQKVKAGASNDVRIPDGMVRTACQNACATEAIIFGDISDADTQVSKAKANDRDYAVLGYLNVRPRTTYLARLRNPNPKISGAEPFSQLEYQQKAGKAHGKGESHGADSHGTDHHATDAHATDSHGTDAHASGDAHH